MPALPIASAPPPSAPLNTEPPDSSFGKGISKPLSYTPERRRFSETVEVSPLSHSRHRRPARCEPFPRALTPKARSLGSAAVLLAATVALRSLGGLAEEPAAPGAETAPKGETPEAAGAADAPSVGDTGMVKDAPGRGGRIYMELCASCHGASGEGVQGEYARPLVGDKSVSRLARSRHLSTKVTRTGTQ